MIESTAQERLDGPRPELLDAPPSTPPAPIDDVGALAVPVGRPAVTTTTIRPDQRPPMPLTAAVIGDSIAKSAREVVTDSIELEGVEVIAYDAEESRRMAVWGGRGLSSGVAAIDGVLDDDLEPELWVVALGTNDVGAGTDPATVQDHIDEVLDEIPDDADLFWVDTWVRDLEDRTDLFNVMIRDRLADRPNSWVLDWNTLAATDGLIIPDGVHLTPRGQLEFARMIGRALRDGFNLPRRADTP